jgi:hypothetical protein
LRSCCTPGGNVTSRLLSLQLLAPLASCQQRTNATSRAARPGTAAAPITSAAQLEAALQSLPAEMATLVVDAPNNELVLDSTIEFSAPNRTGIVFRTLSKAGRVVLRCGEAGTALRIRWAVWQHCWRA